MHAEDAKVQSRFVLIDDKVKVPSRLNLTWQKVVSILCEVGSLASLGMILAGCGGGNHRSGTPGGRPTASAGRE